MSSAERSRIRSSLSLPQRRNIQPEFYFMFFYFICFFVLWLLTSRYRITIGNKSCDFEKEKDPSLLRAPSAGKLLQYTVEDGGHIYGGQSYAEMEVTLAPAQGGNLDFSPWKVAVSLF